MKKFFILFDILENALKGIVIIITEVNYKKFINKIPNLHSPESYNWIISNLFYSTFIGFGFTVHLERKKYAVTIDHLIHYLDIIENKSFIFHSYNGVSSKCKLIGWDKFYDIGILEILDEVNANIVPSKLRQQPIRFAEEVFAIGIPMPNESHLQFTITKDMVNGVNRVFKCSFTPFGFILHSGYTFFFGNRGGSLIDTSGRIVAINIQFQTTSEFSPIDYEAIPTYFINNTLDGTLVIKLKKILFALVRLIDFLEVEFKIQNNQTEIGVVKINDISDASFFINKLQAKEVLLLVNSNPIKSFLELIYYLGQIKVNRNFSITILKGNYFLNFEEPSSGITNSSYEQIANFVLKKYYFNLTIKQTKNAPNYLSSKEEETLVLKKVSYNTSMWLINHFIQLVFLPNFKIILAAFTAKRVGRLSKLIKFEKRLQ
ncbi:MAG: serine protease [Ignavibacteria bacterium]|nr:serine protease [Ignavibacteria bacterium]